MKRYFEVKIVGFDTCEWASTRETQLVEAQSEKEALENMNKWCKEHSYMGGYEWSVEEITEMELVPKSYYESLLKDSRRWQVANNLLHNSQYNIEQNIKDYIENIKNNW